MEAKTERKLEGYGTGIAAYTIWGVLPVYWDWLHGSPALEVLSHRIVWCAVFLTLYLLWKRELAEFCQTMFKSRKTLALLTLNALLITSNWFLYIWAINEGYVMETSLGYFISPILSVLLGYLVLKEKLNRYQWTGVMLVIVGVGHTLVAAGRIPWIALFLAGTFGLYGLVKKTMGVKNLPSLWFESSVAALPCIAAMIYGEMQGTATFLKEGALHDFLLVFSGVVTMAPLVLFGLSTKKLPLSTVGFLQFVAPTLQFLLAVYYFGEPFNGTKFVSFMFIWGAVASYLYGLRHAAKARALRPEVVLNAVPASFCRQLVDRFFLSMPWR